MFKVRGSSSPVRAREGSNPRATLRTWRDDRPILLTGASGYVGGHLLAELLRRGHESARSPATRAGRRPPAAVDARQGDALAARACPRRSRAAAPPTTSSTRWAAAGEEFAARDRRPRRTSAPPRARGVERIVYLGGLGPTGPTRPSTCARATRSPRSCGGTCPTRLRPGGDGHRRRQRVLRDDERAGQPAAGMITPRWVDTRSPAHRHRRRRARARRRGAEAARRAGRGAARRRRGPDLSGDDRRTAAVLGRRPPLVLKVPVLTPRLSSYWVALVTPVEVGLVRPLVDGLKSEMVVEQPPPAGHQRRPARASRTRCGPRWREAAQPAPASGAIADAVIRDPEEHTVMDEDGAVRSIQAADVTLPERGARPLWNADAPRAPRAHLLEVPLARHPRAHPRHLHATRSARSCCSRGRSCCCASTRRSTSSTRDRGVVRWRIRDGLLVAKRGREATATSRSTSGAARRPPGRARVHVEVEIASFYPAIATWIARWFYPQTQSRIHVLVTHGFLRSLARLELEESAVGRFAEPAARRRRERRRRRSPVGDTPWGVRSPGIAAGRGGLRRRARAWRCARRRLAVRA